MRKKTLALVLALTLIVVGVVSGTLAWLTAKSDTVVNTFTTSDIEVKLEETKGTSVTGGKEFKMIPGYELEKDPKAWVVAGSEDCFLFVKLDWANNTYTSDETTKSYLDWTIADGWELVPGETNVYYRTVTSEQMSADNGANNAFPVLKDNKVTVSGDITKEQMNAFTTATLPKLTITAYASQLYKSAGVGFTAAEAWNNIANK
ncbi:hypothetical protein KQI10_10750 [Pseudoflavonifractor sp. MSJ-30]|uniref:hypothetical protein n=1 Tax=Pseudoflavonifractor sp. MSJ-30 TaxID=2841525 RepID=UPI001C103BC1|nr:hypothetical protein [Pseudoflavonifractor sp. MSJ-30]MBU5453645.1 hypothetical protein [Pseudoflavonifractor sp. MSJ-30]